MSAPPTDFVECGERFSSQFDAKVAAHDYAHEGYYFRVIRLNEYEWTVFVKWGRETRPACCKHKRTYVPETPKQMWEPRSTKNLRRKTGHTKTA